jgi:heme iron utilization protein
MAMSEALSNQEIQAAWANLAGEVRTGVLLTLRMGRPFGSHVPYVFGKDWTRAYIHVSRLALHTEHLLEDPRVGLFCLGAGQAGKESIGPTADESSG